MKLLRKITNLNGSHYILISKDHLQHLNAKAGDFVEVQDGVSNFQPFLLLRKKRAQAQGVESEEC